MEHEVHCELKNKRRHGYAYASICDMMLVHNVIHMRVMQLKKCQTHANQHAPKNPLWKRTELSTHTW